MTGGSCYKYQYVVADNVGNTHTATSSANVVKVPVQCGAQLISNGGFENGADPTPWTSSPAGVVTTTGTPTGTWKALLGGQGTNTTETLSQVVTIPANCTATLSYFLKVTTSEGPGTPYDYFRVQVGGVTVGPEFSNVASGTVYVQRTLDLSAYAGQTITLTFLSDEDSSLQTSFWLDDVSLDTAAVAPASYVDTVNGTAGLINYYRMGEATMSAHSMTGTAGVTLQSRSGETAADVDQAHGVYRRRRADQQRAGPQGRGHARRALLHQRTSGQPQLHRRGRRPPRGHRGHQRHRRRGGPGEHRTPTPTTTPATSRPTTPGTCTGWSGSTWTYLGVRHHRPCVKQARHTASRST